MDENYDGITFVDVAIMEDMVEEEFITSILKEWKIPFMVRSFHANPFDSMFQYTLGWGVLGVPEMHVEEVVEFLKTIEDAQKSEATSVE